MRCAERRVYAAAAVLAPPTIIKKYGNRRLYDTGDSRYITLDELAAKIQSGIDVRVVDAKSGDDLTQTTLTQIVIEGRGAARMLPVPLLNQLIRLGDDALAEFLGSYMAGALALYMQAKRGADALAAYNPFAAMPFAATEALARLWSSSRHGAASRASQPRPEWQSSGGPEPASPLDAAAVEGSEPKPEPGAEHGEPGEASPMAASHDDVAELRREIEQLKRAIHSNNDGNSNDSDNSDNSDNNGGDAGKKSAKPKRKRTRKRDG